MLRKSTRIRAPVPSPAPTTSTSRKSVSKRKTTPLASPGPSNTSEPEPRTRSTSKNKAADATPPSSPTFSHQLGAWNGGISKASATTLMNVAALPLSISTEELMKKLKIIAGEFQSMKQQEEDGDYYEFYPLCHHLAREEFLNHKSKDVQILIACCIADILRICAPEAPYKEPEQVKTIFKFLINQLSGVKNVQDLAFTRYFYLMENLSFVKSFEMCFELDDESAQEILTELFEVMLSSVSDNHSDRVKSVIINLLLPLLKDSPVISMPLMDVILKRMIEPFKTSNKSAHQIAKDLLIVRADSLEDSITTLLNNALVGNDEDLEGLSVAKRIYDIISELYTIIPSVMNTVMPQMEYKLKSLNEQDRLEAVKLLAKFFSERDYQTYLLFQPLWYAFLGRFNDVKVDVRIVCVQHSMHLMLNHPGTRKHVEEALCSRLHDSDENVRLEVVKTVVTTAIRGGFEFITGSEQLLECVKERTLDKKFKIRKEALQGLAKIYKIHLDIYGASLSGISGRDKRPPAWIHNRVLQGYYLDNIEDRTLVERLLNTCLVPYKLEVRERMLQLLYVFSTANANAFKAFIEIQKHLSLVRRHILELLNIIRKPAPNEEHQTKVLNARISALNKFISTPLYSSEHTLRFVKDLRENRESLESISRIVDPKSNCKTVGDEVNKFLKRLGAPIMTNVYYGTVKTLLERASAVLIDTEAILTLINLVTELVSMSSNENEENILDEAFPDTVVVIEKGCDFIAAAAYLFSNHFDDFNVLEALLNLTLHDNLSTKPSSALLSAFVFVGKNTRPLGQHQEDLMARLLNHCINLVDTGTPRQAKMALRCLHTNMFDDSKKTKVFSSILDTIQENLKEVGRAVYGTAVVALGHVAFLMGSELRSPLKTLVSRNIVRSLLVKPPRTVEDATKNSNKVWCEKIALPSITRCMLLGMKAMVRWLIGSKTDFESTQKAYKMFIVFVETGGSFIELGDEPSAFPFSTSERAWLRLCAGNCILKISQEKGVGDNYTASQFCTVAKLMNDEILQVRQLFSAKLHKGLSRGIPNKCLPLDFMGFYGLAAFETDRKHRAVLKSYMQMDIKSRREYIKTLLANHPDKDQAVEQVPHIMPDYMLVFALAIFANNPHFTSYEDLDELKDMYRALALILDQLGTKADVNMYYFYKKLTREIKNRGNTADLGNEEANKRLYALCDMVMELMIQYHGYPPSNNSSLSPLEPKVPSFYFQRRENANWQNDLFYLSEEFLSSTQKNKNRLYMPGAGKSSGGKGKQTTPKKLGPQKRVKRGRDTEQKRDDNDIIDAEPTDAKRTRVEMEGSPEIDSEEIVTASSGGSKSAKQRDGENTLGKEDENEENGENHAPQVTSPKTRNLRTLRSSKSYSEAAAGGKEKQKKIVGKRGASTKPKLQFPAKNKV